MVATDGPESVAPQKVATALAKGCRSRYEQSLERSQARLGESVERGAPIGRVSGPVRSSSDRTPHLQVEIRDAAMTRACDPVRLIQADRRRLSFGLGVRRQRFVLADEVPTR